MLRNRTRIWNIGVAFLKNKNLWKMHVSIFSTILQFKIRDSFENASFRSKFLPQKIPSSSSIFVLDRRSKTVTLPFHVAGFPFVPLQPRRRWFQGWKAVKNKVHKVKERLASGCEFLECRSIQPCGTPFSFCPFSYFAPPFLAPPLFLLQTQPKLPWTLFFTAFFSLSFNSMYTCILPPS